MDVQMPDGTIVTGVPDNITQSELLSRYQNFQPPEGGLPTLTSTLPPTSNPLYGLVSRGAGLIGSGLEAVQRVGDYATLKAVNAVPFTNFTPEQAAEVSRPQFVGRAADAAKAYSEGINYTPSTTLGDLGDNPIKVLPFIVERIITSTPDMAAAWFASPAYMTARANEILNDRLKNDEKELKDATVGDVGLAVTAAVIEGKAEQFGLGKLFKGKKLTGQNAASRIGKSTAIQAGIEGGQGVVTDVAGSVGTKRGIDTQQLGENLLENLIVGGGMGAGVKGTQEYLQSRNKPEADFTEPKTVIDPDTGIKRVYSYTPIDDPTLELGGTPEINGRKTYIYTERPLDTEASPEVTPPVAPEAQGLTAPPSQSMNTEEMIAEFGGQQLPLAPPPAAPVAQVAQTEDVQGELPGELAPTPPAAPVAQVAQTADIVPLDDKGEPIKTPESIAPPLDPNVEAQLAAEPFDPESILLPPKEEPPVRAPKAEKVKASEKILSAHEFIASLGGLNKQEASEINKDDAKSNVRIGNKWLYASKGGLSAAQAAEKLAEAGYIETEDNNEVYRVINESLADPVYSINDADAIAERRFNEQALDDAERFEKQQAEAAIEAQDISAEVAAEQAVEAADLGNFRQQMLDAGYTEQDLNVIGFTKASPELQAEVTALMQQVTEAGLDAPGILESLSKTYGDRLITKQEYYAKAKDELAKAIREKAVQGGGRDVSQVDVPEGAAREKSVAPVLSEDIPNERWLQGKVDYAIEKGRNRFGVPHMSTITGTFDKPVEIPLSVLTKLKGESDEQNNVRQKSLEYIRNNWDEVSKSPPYIEVAYNGEAYVSEGNHRIMIAAEKGLKSLPVEIRYFDGGQRKDGPLKPNKIESYKKEEGLTSPSEQELRDQQEAADKADAAKAKAERDAAAKEKADAERKEIAARSEKAAGKFELGKSAEDDLSGQKDLLAIAKKADVPPELQKPTDFVLKEGRIQQVVLAARALADGKITKAEYDAYIDAYAPISTIPNPEGPLSVDGMKRVLKSNQVDKINPDIKDGTRVGIRMDINALKRARALSEKTGDKVSGSVVSIHEGSDQNTQGNIIGYSAAASIKNARFAIRNEQKAFKVAQGIEDKSPQQTIEGDWVNISPEEAYSRVKSLLKDPAWSQVSLDPLRHSFFYDRSNKQPVVAADEILQVGRFVLAKNVKYAERDEFLYSRTADQAADTGLTDAENIARVEKMAADVASKWQNKPNIIVINSIQSPEVPQEVRDASAERSDGTDTVDEGFFYKGNIYLIAPQLTTDADITRAVYHEGLGHFGLRGVFGKFLTPILDQLTVARPDLIKERADAYGLNLEKPAERRLAAEEALAKLAQTNPKLGFVKRSVAAIRTWLRDNVPGFKNLKMTDDQIIRDYIIPARDFVERGKVRSDQAELDEIRFSKKPSQPNLPGIAGKPKGKTQIPKPLPGATWTNLPDMTRKDEVIIALVDKNYNLSRVQKTIEDQVGKIKDEFNTYRKESLSHGRAESRETEFYVKEVLPIIKEMKAKNISDAEMTKYLVMRHAKEANDLIAKRNPNNQARQDNGVGYTYKQREDYFKSLDPERKKEFESIASKVDSILKQTRDILENNGVISAEERKAWEDLFKFYVPTRREESDFLMPSSGYRRVGDFAKSRVGSSREVVDVLSNIVINRLIAINRVEKERIARAFYGMNLMNPNPEYFMAVSPDAVKNKDVLINELQDNFGMNQTEAEELVNYIMTEPTRKYYNKETGEVNTVTDVQAKYQDYVLPVKLNGKDRFVFANPKNPRAVQMIQSLRGLDVKQLTGLWAMAAPITRWFSAVNTQYNLIFGAWNFMRDIQGAQLKLTATDIADKKLEVLNGTFKALPEIYKALRERSKGNDFSDKSDGSWADFILHGGKVGYKDQFQNLKDSTNIVQKELDKLDRNNLTKATYKTLDWISNVNDVMENSTRLSAYRAALNKYKAEHKGKITERDLENMKDRAADIAKNLTVNFNRKGTWGAKAGSLYAFFNASVQGTVNLAQTLRGPAGKLIMSGGIAIGIAQALWLAMAGFDEDEPAEFIKQKNLIFPTGDGGYVMWPMPFGFNIFPNIGRLMVEGLIKTSKGKDTSDKLYDGITMLANSFNPLGGGGLWQMVTPTALDPLAALAENRDSFGRPISRESRGTSPKPGYTLSRDPSPSISQYLSEFINDISFGNKDKRGWVSPTADQLDYLGGQITGGVGREIMRGGKFAMNLAEGKETPESQVPIKGKVVGSITSPQAISQRFYSNVKTMSEHEDAIKGRIDRRENVSQYMRENPESSLWRRANRLETDISKLNARRRDLIKQSAPYEKIKQIDDQKTRMMKQFNDDVKKREAAR